MYRYVVFAAMLCASWPSNSAEEEVSALMMTLTNGKGTEVGIVRFRDGPDGLIVEPQLQGLSPGLLAAHVHEKGDCGASVDASGQSVPGGAAGGHYDPTKTGKHAGPDGDGHLGDLPNLRVEQDGRANKSVVAPRLKVAEVRGRALMIHAGPDDYGMSNTSADAGARESGHLHHPTAHGTGGARAYCGVIK